LSPPVHTPFFHVGFIVPDLDAAMEEFQVALGIEWRAPIDAIVPLLGSGGVVEAEVYSVQYKPLHPLAVPARLLRRVVRHRDTAARRPAAKPEFAEGHRVEHR
jgi:hypothetical protein